MYSFADKSTFALTAAARLEAVAKMLCCPGIVWGKKHHRWKTTWSLIFGTDVVLRFQVVCESRRTAMPLQGALGFFLLRRAPLANDLVPVLVEMLPDPAHWVLRRKRVVRL